MNKIKKYTPQIFLTALALFIYHRWLNFSIFCNSDYQFYFAQALKEYLSPVVRANWWNFGTVDGLFWRLPWNILYGVFGKLGFDSNIADRFLLLWPMVVILPIASFLLVRKITGSNIGAIIGSFVFSYNTYHLAVDTQGQLLLPFAGGFAVLALLLLIKALEEKSFSWTIITGLTLFITSSLDLRVAYMAVFLLCFYGLYYIFIINSRINFLERLRLAYLVFVPLVIAAFLNFYWIIGSLSGESVLNTGILARGLFGGIASNLKYAITLFYPFWNGSQPVWFVPQNIPFYFWAIPIVALLGLWLGRRNPEVLFFGFISVLGIFLTKQSDLPFDGVYTWLFVHLPGFNALREASKFYFFIAVGYSVLIGSFVDFIWRSETKRSWQLYAKYPIIFAVALMLLWNAKPLITGEIGSMWTPRHIEQDYFILKDFIDKQSDYFVTLAVPSGPVWEPYTSNHPAAQLGVLIGTNWKNFVDYADHDNTWPVQDQIIDPLKTSFFNQLADVSSIKYVIVPPSDIQNNDPNFFNFGGEQNPNIRQWYIDQLDQLGWLKKIDIGTKDLVIYENINYRPHIYTTVEQETIHNDIPYEKVESEQENSVKYTVYLSNISTPLFVNFSDNFDPNWKVRVGSFAWDKVFGTDYFLPDRFHSEGDAGLNSFYIDPNYIRQNLPASAYKVNSDGSIDLNLTIYFKPQSYFYPGLIISGATLLACLGYLILVFFRKKKRRVATVTRENV